MKSKVILCCIIVYCSQIVVSIPYAEEDNRQRAYATSNWQNTQIVPQQYYARNVARPHNVNSENQHQNIQGFYENSHENSWTYNHPTLRSRTTEIQRAFNRVPDGGSQQHSQSNYWPTVNAVASANTARIEEPPLINSVRKPYRDFDYDANSERRNFPFREQYHNTERDPSFVIPRERESYHEREPLQEQEIHLERHPIQKTESYNEQDRPNKNEYRNPILENSNNIRLLSNLPLYNRPVHFETKSETFAVPNIAKDKNEHGSDFGSKLIGLPHHTGLERYNANDKTEQPLLKNILGSNKNNHIVVIHANGTVEYLDNLDPVIQNNRNYHIIQPGESIHNYNPQLGMPWTDNRFYEGKRTEPVVPILPIAYSEPHIAESVTTSTTTASTISRSFDNGLRNKLSADFLAKPLSSVGYKDIVTTTEETEPYIFSKQFTNRDNNVTKHDDNITISPIELATENVRTVPTTRKSEDGEYITISPLLTENISKEPSIRKSDKSVHNNLITIFPTESVTERKSKVDKSTKMVNNTLGIITSNYSKDNKFVTESTTATVYDIYNSTEVSLDSVTTKDFLYQKPDVTHGNEIATTTISNNDNDVIISTNNKNLPPNVVVLHNNSQTDNVTPSYIQHTKYKTSINNDSTTFSAADSINTTPSMYKDTTTTSDQPEIPTTDDSKKNVLSTLKESVNNSTQSVNQKVMTQTNDDNVVTASRNSTVIPDVKKNIDDHLLVTTSSTPFTNSMSTANPDNYASESKRSNDIIVELIIPNDDQGDTVNLTVDFPTDDADKNGQEQKTNDDASDSEDTLVFSINTENNKNVSEEPPIKITRTAVVQMGDDNDKNFMIDLTNIKDKPVMWFKTTDIDFIEKVKNGEGECQIMYLFQVQPHLMVDRDTRTTIYENGTVIEEITKTIYDKNGDSSPKIIKTSKVIHPRDSPQ